MGGSEHLPAETDTKYGATARDQLFRERELGLDPGNVQVVNPIWRSQENKKISRLWIDVIEIGRPGIDRLQFEPCRSRRIGPTNPIPVSGEC